MPRRRRSSISPAYGNVLARYEQDVRGGGAEPSWKPIRELCEEAFVQRIESDDEYWNALVRAWRSKAGTPELIPANLAEITALCENGKGRREQWAFLRQQGGSAAVEQAIARLEAKQAWADLVFAFVHHPASTC